MRKLFFLYFFLVVTVLLPWACSDNNSPSKPTAPILASGSITPTFTGTIPTATDTPTLTPTGVAALTATPTWTWIPTPQFQFNYGTSAAPNGMYYDGLSPGTLYVAEAETNGFTTVNALEQFSYLGSGALAYSSMGNQVIVGQATPCAIYQPTPVVYGLTTVSFPVGVAVSSPSGLVGGVYPGMVEVLDASTSSNAASLLVANNYVFCPSALDGGPFGNFTNGFGGAPFNQPKCLTSDANGHFYVADTGNGYVDEFDGGGGVCSPPCSPAWLHRWNGPGAGYPTSLNFIKPNALACDASNNLYVGDQGPYGATNTSMVQVYTSGGTTLLAAVTLIQNCKINGLTVDPSGQTFYVSDANNGEVEEYQFIPFPFVAATPSTQVGLVRAWGDPHSYHEFAPYVPACLQVIVDPGPTTWIIASDHGNNFLNVFGP